MKYKVGDKVVIKTWEEMEKEFRLGFLDDINCLYGFTKDMEKILKDLDTDRIITIKKKDEAAYSMKEIKFTWSDDMIEGLYIEPPKEIFEPILSRFEIMDL